MKFFPFVLLPLLLSCQKKNVPEVAQVIPRHDSAMAQPDNKDPVTSTCSYDNDVSSLGIGLVIAPAQLAIFNDSALTAKLADIDMYRDNGQMICSKFFKPDYGIMHFVCLDSSAHAYNVLTSFSAEKYLPNTQGYEFKTWAEYILGSYGIRRSTSDDGTHTRQQSLRAEPSEDADVVTIPEGHEMFCPVEFQGDWVRVKYDCFYNRENNHHEGEPCYNFINECQNPVTAWLKWKQGNKLLIDIMLLS